jgi:two-component system chemotaxis sensor kinase CheA
VSGPLTFSATEDTLEQFLIESDELLQALDIAVLDLEREPSNRRVVQEIFRVTHTLKSSSAAIGHRPFAELSHALEELLDRLRNGELAATRELVDVLLQSLDALRALTEEVRTRTAAEIDLAPLMGRIAAASAPSAIGGPAPAAAAVRLRADVVLEEGATMPAVRALQVLLALGPVGQIVSSSPTQEQIEREEIERNLSVTLETSAEPEAIRQVLLEVGEVASVTVEPVREEASGPAGSSGPAESADSIQRASRASRTVRIDVDQLDALMNLVGELVVDRTQLQRFAALAEEAPAQTHGFDGLADTAMHIERITTELQVEVMKARMLPVEHVFNRFPRVVRDLSRRFDKEVKLVIEGADTELDRSVIEEIAEPLLHLLRNSIDHGIETPDQRVAAGKSRSGTLRLAARHEAGQILIEVADDGKGIDAAAIRRAAVERGLITRERAAGLDEREALDLVFLPGLTTAREVSDVSGRGVGMDAVRVTVERLNGSIALTSRPGVGTRFSIRLPLTLAIVRALLVNAEGRVYALPLGSVVETMMVERDDLRRVHHRTVIDLRGTVMPILSLTDLLAGRDPSDDGQRLLAVAVQHGKRQVGLRVDSLIGEQEIVIKPLDALFAGVECIGGTAILGDGSIAPIVNVPGLIKELVEAGQAPTGVEG